MKKSILLLFFSIYILFTVGVKAQSSIEQKIDSLKTFLEQPNDFDKEAELLNQLSELEYNRGELKAGLSYAMKANEIGKKNKDGNILGVSYIAIAQYYSYTNNYTESIKYYEKALTHFKELDDIWRIAFTSYYLGVQYSILSISDKALENFYTSLKYYKKNNQPEGIIIAYTQIGALYSKTNEYEKAPVYLKKAIQLCEETNDVHNKIHLLENLGVHYYRHGQFDLALQYLFEGIDLAKKHEEYKHDLASGYVYIGEIKTKQNKFEEALNYLLSSERYYKEMSLYRGEIGSKRRLAFLYYEQGEYHLAKENIQKSIDFHLKTKEKNPLFDDYRLLSLINEGIEDYKLALENYKLFKIYQDSLQLNDASKNAMNFEFDKKETELKTQQKAELTRKSVVANTTYGVLGTILLFSIFALYTYWIRNKKLQLEKQNIDLKRREAELAKDAEEFKARFLSNISHEFRTPLTLINGHLEILKKEGDAKNNKRFNEMEYSSKHLLQLINQLLDLTKIETRKYSLYYKKGNLLNETQNYVQAFHSLAEERKIKLSSTTTFNANVKFALRDFAYSSEALASIINNLLSNALKFTPEGGSVHTTIDYVGSRLYISVRDSGLGIPPDDLPNIFDRFYQVSQKGKPIYEGSGIGLAIVKELAHFHGGDAEVISNPEGGCTFTVWLAEGSNSYARQDEEALTIPELDYSDPILPMDEKDEENKTLILVVEDQRELRKFIVENLGEHYRFLEAENGRQGVEMALEHLPEIIISDVMMPEMDGFQLTQALKTNEITSHIPIVLLTAKAEQADKIEGLEYGADDYLTKPFSVAELQLRVKNRLQQQEIVRHKFAGISMSAKTEEVPELNVIDRDFIEKLNNFVLQNIENEIDVSLLASEIGLSNSQLTRKLKVLIGVTPANLIKNIRLNFALELLREGFSVSETSWKSGFEEPAYFSKVFKKHFGFLPSEKEMF